MITVMDTEQPISPRLRDIVGNPWELILLTQTFRQALRKAAKKHGNAQVKEMAFWVVAMEESLVELIWAESLLARMAHYQNWNAYKRRAWDEFDALQQVKVVA